MNKEQKIGRLLRKTRNAAGMSLGQAGQKIGVSIAYLSDVERGRRSVSAQRLAQIATAINMSKSERVRLFVTAGVIPPTVSAHVLAHPKIWDLNLGSTYELIVALLEVSPKTLEKLGKTVEILLKSASTPQEW